MAWAQVLAKSSGRDDVVLAPSSQVGLQGTAGADRVLGMFINTLPLKVELARKSVSLAVATTYRRLGELLEHEQAPLSQAQRCSGVAASKPLFNSLLNYRHSAGGAGGADFQRGIPGMRLLHGEEHTNYPLAISIDDDGSGFSISAQCHGIEAGRINAYLKTAIESLTGALLASENHAASRLNVVPPAEQRLLLEEFNATTAKFEQSALIQQVFEFQVDATPEAVAAVFGDLQLTYAELNRQANRLAHALLEMGVKPDDRVAIFLERSLNVVIAMLGIIKAGAAYVPLDTSYPAERLAAMVEDSAPVAVLTLDALRDQLPTQTAQALSMDNALWREKFAAMPDHNPDWRALGLNCRHLAYVIYTSGSTGIPKGVSIEQRSVVRLAMARDYVTLGPESVVAQASSVSFDAATFEVWGALLNGARLVYVDKECLLSPARLSQQLRRDGVTVLFLTTALFNRIAQEAPDCFAKLDTLLFGGELVSSSAVQTIVHTGKPRHLMHVYGPTENTTFSSKFEITANHFAHSNLVPIGSTLAGTRFYVLGAELELLPFGAVGELFLGGEGLARGYLNRPELNHLQFVQDPFNADPEAKLYRTGDLVRWLPGGNILYLGRNDTQVKIRGFRIELGEIEAKLAACTGVHEARVLVREDVPGEKRLVAYLIADGSLGDASLSPELLRAELAGSLADYMIPSAFIVLEAYPLTQNGKLDKRALPAPDLAASSTRSYQEPQGDAEVALATIWQNLLGLDKVGRYDHFFELGGHSLIVISLIERMRQQGWTADVRLIYAAPTLMGMAEALQNRFAGPAIPATIPLNGIVEGTRRITPEMLTLVDLSKEEIDQVTASIPGGAGNVQDIYPLAPLQEGILFHHLLEERGDAYLLRGLMSFDNRERLDTFVAALQLVIDRHDILRSSVHWQNLPKAVQVVHRHAALPVTELAPRTGMHEALLGMTDPDHVRLDLQSAPLLKAFIGAESMDGEWQLALLHHHLVSDHVTMELMIAEVQTILAGQNDTLPQPYPFRNFIAQLRNVPDAAHEAYFKAQLGDVSEPTAPFGLLDVQSGVGKMVESKLNLDADLSQQIRSRARALGVTPATLFHVAWAQVLARCCDREDIVFGTVLLGRLQGTEAADSVLGMFMNTLPVRVSLGARSVAQAVSETNRRLTDLMMHEQAPLALAQRCSGVQAPLPLFTSLLNYRHSGNDKPDAQAAATDSVWQGMRVLRSEERTNYPITVNVDDLGKRFALKLQCVGVDPLRIAQYLQVAIAGLVQAQGHEAVIDLPVLGREELDLQLQTWNHSEHDFPLDHTFHALFEQRVASHPERIAVVCGGTTLSYRELDERASRIAAALIAAGAGQDSLVTLMSERSPVLLAMMLAVFKAGAAFLPLDVNHPAERLREIMSASGSTLALVSDTCVPMLEQCATGLHGIAVEPIWQHGAAPVLPALGAPDDLAYVIFTSGSTGKPKGAMVEQRGMINHMFGKIVTMRIDEHDCLAQTASPAFDICVWQFLSALLVGGRVDILEDEIAYDPTRLLSAVESHGITLLQTVPSMMRSLLDVCPADITLDGLRWMIPTGEALTLNITQEWFERFPAIGLMNVYGPAECSDDVTYQAITKRPAEHSVIPIGRPTPNNRIYLLDRHLRPVPLGVNGEICVAGTGVGRGYLNNPEQTAAAFIAHPLAQGGRFYRTGDVGRYRADGVIEFMGRIDHQVKIRGFRIEPGEVEAKLSSCDGVREAVVLVREDQPGEKRLVAYLVAQQGAQPTPLALREQMLALLADYMVPSAFVVLDTFPLTPNGKLDRRALPAPDTAALVLQQYEAPQGETEIAIAAIWRELLGLEQVGRNDHFFELGGHSLMVVSMIEKLRRHGHSATVRMAFSAPTLAELAQAISGAKPVRNVVVPENLIAADSRAITPAMLPLVTLNQAEIDLITQSVPDIAHIQDIYPLAPLQEGMLFHHLLEAEGDIYLRRSVVSFDSRQRLDEFLSALQTVINRHDILRSAIRWEGLSQPVQVVMRHAQLPVQELTLPGTADVIDELHRATDPRHMRLDLMHAPLIAARIAADPHSGAWHMALLNHHLVSDHVTMDLIIEEIRMLLGGQSDQLPTSLPYRNFIAHMLSVAPAEHEAYFRRRLADIEEPTAPFGLLDVQSDGAEHEAQLPFDAAWRAAYVHSRAAAVSLPPSFSTLHGRRYWRCLPAATTWYSALSSPVACRGPKVPIGCWECSSIPCRCACPCAVRTSTGWWPIRATISMN